MCVSTCLVKVTIMKLVKEHYFVDGTWRSQQAQVFLASCHWLMVLMHRNKFGLKQRSKKIQISGRGAIAVQDVSKWFSSVMQDAKWIRIFL